MSRKNKSVIAITIVILIFLIAEIIYYVGCAIKYDKKFDYVDERINKAESRLDNAEYRLDRFENRVDKIEKGR